jgi:lysophospholipase
MKMRKVVVFYTGGTIGMEKNSAGVIAPSPNKLLEKLRTNTQTHHKNAVNEYKIPTASDQLVLLFENSIILYKIMEYTPLLDSSNVAQKEWIRMAEDIGKSYEDFDGFVILHGTDTLAYTASALSFMLQNIQKPVVITGSQISIFETRNDAYNNIVTSIILAACYPIKEVCVCFNNELLRGSRTAKVSSTRFNAFASPNYPHLAHIGSKITLNECYIRTPKQNCFVLNANLCRGVEVVTIAPMITAEGLRGLLRNDVKGAVLRTYGSGNICSDRREIVDILIEAVKRETLIVNITQCINGGVTSDYETGAVRQTFFYFF